MIEECDCPICGGNTRVLQKTYEINSFGIFVSKFWGKECFMCDGLGKVDVVDNRITDNEQTTGSTSTSDIHTGSGKV
jgi:hypothetical protein